MAFPVSPPLIDFPWNKLTYPESPVPLKGVSARVQIFDGIGKVELEHVYRNTSEQNFETSFRFPIGKKCAVTKLVVVTEDQELEAKIVGREKAAQKYEDATARGNAAYKLEYDKDDENGLLVMNIGNLLPKRELTIRLTMLVRLPIFDKSWALILSPSMTPRFPMEGA